MSSPRSLPSRGLGLLAVATLVALTGCAASDNAASETAETTAAAAEPNEGSGLLPEGEGTTEYPLTLTTWAGETVLEERPERIAVVGFSPTFDVLEVLGVTPIYAVTDDKMWEWRDPEWVEGIEFVDSASPRDGFSFEAIASAEPDLIVALNTIWEESDYDKLAAIAPVVDFAELEGDKADWREGQRIVGEALDLSAAADAAIADADEAVAAVAEAHPEFAGTTVTIAMDYGPEWGFEYYTPTGSTAEGFMLDLGFDPHPEAGTFVTDSVISDENVSLLEADTLVAIYSDEAIRDAREAQPLFAAIPAVAEGRYVSLAYSADSDALLTPDGEEVPNATWVLRRGVSALSLPWAAEVIADQWLPLASGN